jgi:histidine triad (HIT) family protein
MTATGASAYNVLQNNGRAAHQAVFHVHFHIIPRFEREGLGIVWNAGRLSKETAKHLVEAMQEALAADSSG